MDIEQLLADLNSLKEDNHLEIVEDNVKRMEPGLPTLPTDLQVIDSLINAWRLVSEQPDDGKILGKLILFLRAASSMGCHIKMTIVQNEKTLENVRTSEGHPDESFSMFPEVEVKLEVEEEFTDQNSQDLSVAGSEASVKQEGENITNQPDKEDSFTAEPVTETSQPNELNITPNWNMIMKSLFTHDSPSDPTNSSSTSSNISTAKRGRAQMPISEDFEGLTEKEKKTEINRIYQRKYREQRKKAGTSQTKIREKRDWKKDLNMAEFEGLTEEERKVEMQRAYLRYYRARKKDAANSSATGSIAPSKRGRPQIPIPENMEGMTEEERKVHIWRLQRRKYRERQRNQMNSPTKSNSSIGSGKRGRPRKSISEDMKEMTEEEKKLDISLLQRRKYREQQKENTSSPNKSSSNKRGRPQIPIPENMEGMTEEEKKVHIWRLQRRKYRERQRNQMNSPTKSNSSIGSGKRGRPRKSISEDMKEMTEEEKKLHISRLQRRKYRKQQKENTSSPNKSSSNIGPAKRGRHRKQISPDHEEMGEEEDKLPMRRVNLRNREENKQLEHEP